MKLQSFHKSVAEYELFPRVIRIGVSTQFSLRGRGINTAFTAGEQYLICVLPHEENNSSIVLRTSKVLQYENILVTADGEGELHFCYTFPREQTYTLALFCKKEEEWERTVDLRIFAAADDLWARTPMRGNTHCHACTSVDGYEDPAMVAATYRKAGFDYLAITDHRNINGSLKAMEAFKDIPHGIALYKGEEVHAPSAYIHAVNVGADFGGIGLNDYYLNNKEVCEAEVAALAEALPAELPFGVERMDLAWRSWVAQKIHEKGGIAIAAHPFWIWDTHNTRNAMLRYLAEHRIYDAMEVTSGQDPGTMEANLQIAFWNDMRAEGIYMPIVGCDDAHLRHMTWNTVNNCFNMSWTLIFAKEPSFDGFAEAIRSGQSVSVSCYDGTTPHVVGTYRLTQYTVFLLEQYLPMHDELCFTEGQLLWDAYQGDESALALLPEAIKRVEAFKQRFFGRG